MKAQAWSWMLVPALVCAAALRPTPAWSEDLDAALGHGQPVVVLVAMPDRPLGDATRRAVDAAWEEIRPRARRVSLERGPAAIGSASALALCVFDGEGELVARRDGALGAALAEVWLREALDAAADPARKARRETSDPAEQFEAGQRASRLGAAQEAERIFVSLCRNPRLEWRIAAWERLARSAILRGEVAQARELCELANGSEVGGATAARFLFTRGLIEFAERKSRAACATLELAVRGLENGDEVEFDAARFELARAQAARGEASSAIDALECLARTASTCFQREAARRLAAELRSPPLTH
ncbi:MAG TPA: hypothetical protein VK843_13075 [Planctomycetota bacterium]|nr:hypothetical protein [Planctomycetota bacterium]